ncbi:hypothetical protein [Coraliomargarita parva]|uniref:hypothetical protein n=1 Tax=Coraliomargarita parva TaxID=3014050 RepID=UPI0022B46630|nr:hypothetical protein [Coraliomargarita parva]
MKPSPPDSRRNAGFALVVALSLMAFLLLLLLSLTTMVRIDQQAASVTREIARARANAILGLQIALGELQVVAGADQRVTGTAELASDSLDDNQKHWTGVWDVSGRNSFDAFSPPADVAWLVSGKNSTGDELEPGDTVVDGILLVSSDSEPSNNVLVGKMGVTGSDDAVNGHYAFWVGDEGVKAKVNLVNPHRDGSDEANRYTQMTAQRNGIEVISIDESGNTLGSVIDPDSTSVESLLPRVESNQDFPLLDPALDSLYANRIHDVTTVSYGLLSNVKKGGLKKDLSLAFEMDFNDFNADSTFASGGESVPFISDHQVNYLFTFDDFPVPGPDSADALVRGPSWHLLRNYYRLYKDDDPDRMQSYKYGNPLGVQKSGSGYTIASRPYFPEGYRGSDQRNSLPQAYYDVEFDQNVNDTFKVSNMEPIPRVTDMAITPLITRMQIFISVQAVEQAVTTEGETPTYRVDLHFNPVVTIWNPYNVSLSFTQFSAGFSFINMPITIHVTPPAGTLETYVSRFQDLGGSSKGNVGWSFRMMGTEALEPGEIRVYSDLTMSSNQASSAGYLSAQLGATTLAIQQTDALIYDKIIDASGTSDENSTMQSLIVEEGTQLSLEISNTSRINVSSTLRRWVPGGWDDKEITLGYLYTNDSSNENFIWPSATAGDYVLVEEIASTVAPERHPVGMLDAHLKASTSFAPPQFLGLYNPRASSFRRNTGSDKDGGEEIPSVGNWFLGLSRLTNWSSGEPSIAPDGSGYWGDSNTGGDTRVTLFEIPTMPLQSLAALQHVNNVNHYAQEPAYVIGNSLASPFIDRGAVTRTITDSGKSYTQVDWSFLANDALWDDYYFSSLAPRDDLNLSDTEFDKIFQEYLDGESLPDSRMRLFASNDAAFLDYVTDASTSSGIAADAYKKLAASLVVDGAFNVNSTSVEAWKALLSSLNGIDMEYVEGDSTLSDSNIENPFSRMSLPGGDDSDDWRGFRSLSNAEIENLAQEIVQQVKDRGPFVSLSDFVNRRLATDGTGLKGALQAAIEETNINDQFSDSVNSQDVSDANIAFPEHAIGKVASGAPGYLRQSDLLMSLGPVMAARSDTFTIRSYGDYEDPVSGQKTKVYCEAVVQRVPDYVETGLEPYDDYSLSTAGGLDLGRRFVIRSFRWLNSEEI